VLWIGASAGLLVAAALGITQYSTGNAQSLPAASGVRITGTLKLVVPRIPGVSNSTGTGAIMLPDRKVTLRNGSGSDVASAITLLDGRFDLIAPSAGTYSVCWEIGESRGCSKQLVVSNKTVGTDVLARLATPVLYGLVLTGDDRPCWVQDSYFKLDVATFVAAGGKKVRANIRGEYAIVGLAPATYTLTANCENARVSQQVAMPAGGANVKLALPNHAPRLVATYATDGTKSLTRAAPGAMVKLVADTRDPDGDRVEHLWRAGSCPTTAARPGPMSSRATARAAMPSAASTCAPAAST
jgi:hypothetical protein